MDARCEKCGAAYAFEDARIPESGVSVRCTRCAHVFAVRRPPPRVAPPVPPLAAPPGRVAVPHGAGRWQLRRTSGEVEALTELSVLHRWIVDRQVGRDDALSTDGQAWHRLGDLPELSGFFLLAEGPERGTPPPTSPSGGEVVSADALASGPSAPPAEARPSVAPLILVPLVALVVGAIGALFLLRAQATPEAPAAPEVARAAPAAQAPSPTPSEPAPAAAEAPPTLAPPGSAAGSAAQGAVGATTQGAVAGTTPATGAATPGPSGTSSPAGSPPEGATPARASPAAALPSAPVAASATRPSSREPSAEAAPRKSSSHAVDELVAEGDRLRERGRASAAMNAYGRAAELAPTRAEPQVGRGLALLDMGNYLPAQAAFEQALKLDPRSGRALMGMAELHRAQGHRDEALRYYERYLATQPSGPEARAARAAIERLKD